ncbi:unnamed protein product [Caenorhabditis sp. 36 PRJEB53466]|nr:unnamed protein product [Caenorhabditis sp. 36 PRJEB53466]
MSTNSESKAPEAPPQKFFCLSPSATLELIAFIHFLVAEIFLSTVCADVLYNIYLSPPKEIPEQVYHEFVYLLFYLGGYFILALLLTFILLCTQRFFRCFAFLAGVQLVLLVIYIFHSPYEMYPMNISEKFKMAFRFSYIAQSVFVPLLVLCSAYCAVALCRMSCFKAEKDDKYDGDSFLTEMFVKPGSDENLTFLAKKVYGRTIKSTIIFFFIFYGIVYILLLFPLCLTDLQPEADKENYVKILVLMAYSFIFFCASLFLFCSTSKMFCFCALLTIPQMFILPFYFFNPYFYYISGPIHEKEHIKFKSSRIKVIKEYDGDDLYEVIYGSEGSSTRKTPQ